MEGGIESIEAVKLLTWKDIDYRIQREVKLVEDGWDYTRHIIGALAGKKPKQIMKLSRDPEPKKWTQEEALKVIDRFNGRDRKDKR